MSWDAIGTIGEKIGLLAVFVLVGFVIAKLLARFLAHVTFWSHPDAQEPSDDPNAEEPGRDPADDEPGLHVFSDYCDQYGLVEKNPTEDTIRAAVRGLDWVEGFHIVMLVKSPGVCLDVGGSLDPEYGLSSTYRDSYDSIVKVIKEPPISVKHMEDLLVSFHLGDGRWDKLNEYD